MAVWGIAARIEGGNPLVIGVELSGPGTAPRGREVFRHRSEATDRARVLMLLANDLDAELRKGAPTVVVVRAMDWSSVRRENVVRLRLQVEGLLLAVARRAVPIVVACSGKEIGDLCGVRKEQVAAEAQRLLPSLDRDAASAGIAALVLAERA